MKKFLAFLLSFAMICSMMTVVVFADSESNEAVEENESVMALELVELEEEQLATLSYVPFSSGVYRFDSLYNIGMCMTVEDGEYTSGALVVQWNTSSNAQDTLFKVEYAGTGIIPATNGNADYYVIRSMVNSEIGLTAATPASGSNAVTLQTLSANNSNQYWNQYWVHMEDSGCDVWMNAATGTCLGSPEGNANNSALEMSGSGANTWWQLAEYTGGVIEGIQFISGATSAYGGEVKAYEAIMYSSRIGVNGPVQYDVIDLDGTSTDKAYFNSNDALVAQKAGSVQVVASASGLSSSATRTVTITGYATADFAAIGCAQACFAASCEDNIQYATVICEIVVGNITTYDYAQPFVVSNSPTTFPVVVFPVYDHITAIGYIHTTPTASGITSQDRARAESDEMDYYVIGTDNKVHVYEYLTNNERVVGSF